MESQKSPIKQLAGGKSHPSPFESRQMAKIVNVNPAVETVNEEVVEASIKAKGIGKKIRRLRLKRSMGLVELGEQVGLSASFLSQLETGRVVPTLKNLARIALVFKKELADFFKEEGDTLFRVSRSQERIRLLVGEKENPFLISDSLSVLIQGRDMIPCVAEFLPGREGTAFHPNVFAGLELVYVIEGPLAVATEHTTELLHPKDSAWIDGNTKRQYKCHEDKPARALIISFALSA
jgi:transcriptional regulator with XRE-family HTH domain